MKLVKPSELSLDLISPNKNMRNNGIKATHGIQNLTSLGGNGPQTGSNNNNVKNIL